MQIVLTDKNGKKSYEVSEELFEITKTLKSKYKIHYICSDNYIFRIAVKKNNLWITISFDKFIWVTDAYAIGTKLEATVGGYREENLFRLIDKFQDDHIENASQFFTWIFRNGWNVKEENCDE